MKVSPRTAQTILTILMLAVVAATGLTLISVWLLPPPEQTAAIAILNENRQAGPYPTNVTLYSNITLYVEVDNLMGSVQYFYVRVKLATANTMANATHPSPAPQLYEAERILLHGESWVFPLELNMTTPGVNFRLTFELWRYNPASDAVVYMGIWVHLPLNVTST